MARPSARRAALVAGAVALPWAAAALARRARLVAALPPDLRRASLLVPLGLPPAPLLPLARRLPVPDVEVPPGVTALRRTVPGDAGGPPVDVLVVEPTVRRPPAPALLWVHGGGHVLGEAYADLAWCVRLADELGVVVVAPDHRLAPEHPYPAGHDDCRRVLRWLRAEADDLGVDPDRLAVGGASAGGGVAASLAGTAADDGIPLRLQLLVYPMLDDRTGLRLAGPRRLGWSHRSNRRGWAALLGRSPRDRRPAPAPPRAAPARQEDLTGLPPAWLGVGTLDVLHDETVEHARRLRAAGVTTRLVVVPGMYHGAWGAAAATPRVATLQADAVAHLATALGTGPEDGAPAR